MGYEREDGEVTEDEEEVVLTSEVTVQLQPPTTKLTDVNDLRLAVFRSVVERKMAEKSLNSEGTNNLPPRKKSKAPPKEINPPSQLNGGSSSDMEVEMWDLTEAGSKDNRASEIGSDETTQSVLKPDIRQPDELLRAAVSASIATTVAAEGISLLTPACPPKGASNSFIGEGLSINAVFHFKEGERLDSFGLGLQERKLKKHKGAFDSNATSAESQKLAAIFSYWHANGNKAESPSFSFSCSDERGDAAGLLTGPTVGIKQDVRLFVSSMERQLANPSMKRTASTVSMTGSTGTAVSAGAGTAGSITAGTVNGARAAATASASAKGGANGKKEAANILSSSILKSTSTLTAAQQRSKIEEDIARLKVEILMREKKAKRLLPGSGLDCVRAPVKKTSPSPLAARAPATLSMPISAPAPVLDVEVTPIAVAVGAMLPIASCLLPVIDTITAPAPAPPSVMMSGLLDEHLLRAAALISRKKKQKDKSPKSACTGVSPGLAVSLAAFVPVPPSAPLPASPVRRAKTYPSSRCNLAFSGGRNYLLAAPPVNTIEAFNAQEHMLMNSVDTSIMMPFPSHPGSTGVDGWGQGQGQGWGWGPADMQNEPGICTQGPLPSYSHPNGAPSTSTLTPRNIKSSSRLADPLLLEEGEEVEECVEMAGDCFYERWRALTPHPPSTITSNNSSSSSGSNRKRNKNNKSSSSTSTGAGAGAGAGAKYLKSPAVGGHYSHAAGLASNPHHPSYRHRIPIHPNNGQTVNSLISVRESPTSLCPSNIDVDVDMDVDMEIDIDVDVNGINGVQAIGAPVNAVTHPLSNTDTSTITHTGPPTALPPPSPPPTCSPAHLPADLIQRLKLLKKQQQLKSKKKISTHPVADTDVNTGMDVEVEVDGEYLDNEFEQCTVEVPAPVTVPVPAKVKDSSAHPSTSVPSTAPIPSDHTPSNHIHSDHIHPHHTHSDHTQSNGKGSAADTLSGNHIATRGSRALSEKADIFHSDSSALPLNTTIDPTTFNISSDNNSSDKRSSDDISSDNVTAPCTAMHKGRDQESDVLCDVARTKGVNGTIHTYALPLPMQPSTDTSIDELVVSVVIRSPPLVPTSISDLSTAVQSSRNPSLPTTTSYLTAEASIDTTPLSLTQHSPSVPTVPKATAQLLETQTLRLREAELKVGLLAFAFVCSISPP